jgi:hypothetical protein
MQTEHILIPKYIAENLEIQTVAVHHKIDFGNFIPEFSVIGVFLSSASVICGGNFLYFLPQCRSEFNIYTSNPTSGLAR